MKRSVLPSAGYSAKLPLANSCSNASTSFQSLKIDYNEDKPPLEPTSIYSTLGCETVPEFPAEDWLVFHVIENLCLFVRGTFWAALIKTCQSLTAFTFLYAVASYHFIRLIRCNMSRIKTWKGGRSRYILSNVS